MQGGPGRGIYLARRIVVALVVLILFVLLGIWAWQTLFKPGEPQAPETASVGTTGGEETSTEEASTEEAPAGVRKVIVVYRESPDESAGVSTEGAAIGSPEAANLTAAVVPPVVPAAPPVLAAAAPAPPPPAPTVNTPPAPSPPANTTNARTSTATQIPSTPRASDLATPGSSRAGGPSAPTGNRLQEVQPSASGEPAPSYGPPVGFEEEAPLGEAPAWESTSNTGGGGATAIAGGATAIAGNGAMAKAGGVTTKVS